MDEESGRLKFVVCGVGGAGCNSVKHLASSGFKGAKLVALNTDKTQLSLLKTPDIHKVLIGKSITKGLGAGGDPLVGEKSALASKKLIEQEVHDADMVFLLAGMGGGTGTGAAPIVAEMAREHGAIVLSFVYFPFALERARIKGARKGISKLTDFADTLVVIENDRLVKWASNVPIEKAFAMADDVAAKAVSGISKTILEPSLMNLDFADVKNLTKDKGLSMISHGEATGHMRVQELANSVLGHPLLDVDYSKASGALLHFTGGEDLTLGDATTAGELLMEKLPENVDVAWGARVDDTYKERLDAFAIFTGIPSPLLLDPSIFERKEKGKK